MPDKVFFDTNVLVYAFDSSEAHRHDLAMDILESHLKDRTAVLSLQVLQEFFVTVTRKIEKRLELKQARDLVVEFLATMWLNHRASIWYGYRPFYRT